jgi:desulfoferrodoxin (superoxide reductase-like protein)
MSKKVKRAVILSLVGIFTIFALTSLGPNAVNAHAPKNVLPAYDGATKTLSVTVTHTYFSESHYINKVEIKKNGTVVAVQEYKGQPSETFTYTYKIDAVSGDTLEVKASCNKFGSTSETITVGKGSSKTPS